MCGCGKKKITPINAAGVTKKHTKIPASVTKDNPTGWDHLKPKTDTNDA